MTYASMIITASKIQMCSMIDVGNRRNPSELVVPQVHIIIPGLRSSVEKDSYIEMLFSASIAQ
jgi:hypothetical protein